MFHIFVLLAGNFAVGNGPRAQHKKAVICPAEKTWVRSVLLGMMMVLLTSVVMDQQCVLVRCP